MSAVACIFALATTASLAVLGSWLHSRSEGRIKARAEAMEAQHNAAPYVHRLPGVARDAADEQSARRDHVDAVWAQCIASPPYVMAVLCEFESEVTGLAELGLELDDQSPKPASPYDE